MKSIPDKLIIRGYLGAGIGAALIKILPYRRFSHVSLVFYFPDREPVEWESIQPRGVCHHLPTKGKNFEAFRPALTHAQIEEAYKVACKIKGSYDFSAIFGFVFRRTKQNPLKWICSEFVAYVMYKIDCAISKRDPYMETPSSVCDSNASGPRVPDYEDINDI